MGSLLHDIIINWGLSGIAAAAAIYLIWENFKRNKEIEDHIISRTDHAIAERKDNTNTIIQSISNLDHKVDNIDNKVGTTIERVDKIEDRLDRSSNWHVNNELEGLNSTISIAPTIYNIIGNYMDDIQADHIAIGMLHNGVFGITNLPFYKYDILMEKFSPIRHPNDKELCRLYKNAELSLHNKLPGALIQDKEIYFDLTDEANRNLFSDMDDMMYHRCTHIGIKYIMFTLLQDASNNPIGFCTAYSFDKPIRSQQMKEMTKILSQLYSDIKKTNP